MPRPLDKALKLTVQALFLQGVRPQAIAEQTGVNTNTIQTWNKRGKWMEAASNVKANAEQAVDGIAASSLAKTNEFVRESLAGSIAHVATKLSEKRPKSLKAAMAQQAKLEATVRNAKAVFGWREGNEGSPIRINVMANAVQLNTGQVSGPSAKPEGDASPTEQPTKPKE